MTTAHHPISAPEQAAPTLQPTVLPPSYTDGFGIASIVCVFLFFSLPGFVLGLIGASKAKKAGVSPVLSRVGWILNLIGMILGFIVATAFIIYAIAHPDDFKPKSSSGSSSLTNSDSGLSAAERSVSANGITLSVPNSYIDISDEYTDAKLAQSEPSGSPSVIVYFQETVDVPTGTTIEAYADQSFKSFQTDTRFTGSARTLLPSGTVANPDNLTKIDYKITAAYDLHNYTYYERYIKTTRGYYIISAWTSPSNLGKHEAEMKRILASFRES
ncbi:hypothetical protein IPM09_00280 [Candidatus Saccharibacteria bacterium]|nr:MAG: hypothetical protein IPM09_00280 [Candidatus Saccharibacteria bacterium]